MNIDLTIDVTEFIEAPSAIWTALIVPATASVIFIGLLTLLWRGIPEPFESSYEPGDAVMLLCGPVIALLVAVGGGTVGIYGVRADVVRTHMAEALSVDLGAEVTVEDIYRALDQWSRWNGPDTTPAIIDDHTYEMTVDPYAEPARIVSDAGIPLTFTCTARTEDDRGCAEAEVTSP